MSEEAAKMAKAAESKSEGSRYRILQGPMGLIQRSLSVALPVFTLVCAEALPRLGIFFYPAAQRAVFLAIGVFLVFLYVPMTPRQKNVLPWYDVAMGLWSTGSAMYVAIDWPYLYQLGGVKATPVLQVVGTISVIILIEAARRAVGRPVLFICLGFVCYTLFAHYLPGVLWAPKFSWSRIISYFYFSDNGVFGVALGIVSTVVMAFLIFGSFLARSGAGRFYIGLAKSALGSLRGGAAKVSVLACALFGTMTGDPMSCIGIVGPLTFPLMRQREYDRTFASATVAASSCGAMVMPPVMGAVAFLMAEMIKMPYSQLALRAIVPALLFFASILFQVDFFSARHGYVGIPKTEIEPVGKIFKEGWIFLAPILLLMVLLLVFQFSPVPAANLALLLLLVVTAFKEKWYRNPMFLVDSLVDATRGIIPTMAAISAAGVIMGAVSITGVGVTLSNMIGIISGGNLLILALLVAGTIYIMGMAVAPIIIYLLMATLAAPAMVTAGAPLLAAHFFIFYIAVSAFITPPVCGGAYMSAAMNGAPGVKTGFTAMRLSAVCYLIPFFSLYSPALLGIGTTGAVILAGVTGLVGVFLMSVGIEGFLYAPVPLWQRPLLVAGGVMLLMPGSSTDLIGLGAGAIPIALAIAQRRRAASST